MTLYQEATRLQFDIIKIETGAIALVLGKEVTTATDQAITALENNCLNLLAGLAAKLLFKEGSKQAGKAAMKEGAKKAAKEEAKKTAKELGKEEAKQGAKKATNNVQQRSKSAKKEQPWNIRPEQQWKRKVVGRAQKTGTPGHAMRAYREAIREAKKADTEKVFLNRGYNKATGLKIRSNRRPDILVKKKDGTFHPREVPSRTDKVKDLRARNEEALGKLPEHMKGEYREVKINNAK